MGDSEDILAPALTWPKSGTSNNLRSQPVDGRNLSHSVFQINLKKKEKRSNLRDLSRACIWPTNKLIQFIKPTRQLLYVTVWNIPVYTSCIHVWYMGTHTYTQSTLWRIHIKATLSYFIRVNHQGTACPLITETITKGCLVFGPVQQLDKNTRCVCNTRSMRHLPFTVIFKYLQANSDKRPKVNAARLMWLSINLKRQIKKGIWTSAAIQFKEQEGRNGHTTESA